MSGSPARALAALWLACLPTGCAPGLSEPERFADAGCGDVPTLLLAARCGSSECHDAFEPAAGMDLVSGDVAERLAGIDAVTCAGRRRIDPHDPGGSFVLERVSEEPECNGEAIEQMPLGGPPLSARERACLAAWVEEVAASYVDRVDPLPDAGVDAGPTDAGLADAGLADAGLADAGLADAGASDAGFEDASAGDGG